MLEGVDPFDHVFRRQLLKRAAMALDLGLDGLCIAVRAGKLALGPTPPSNGWLDRQSSIDRDIHGDASPGTVMTESHERNITRRMARDWKGNRPFPRQERGHTHVY